MFGFIKRMLSTVGPAGNREQVTFDEQGVTRTMPDGETETVNWHDLLRVEIATTNEGPFLEDVFFLLSAADHGCVVPQGAEGMDALLERLQALPGFDDEAVIRAMGCTDNALFSVWSRGQGSREGESEGASMDSRLHL